MSNSFTLAPSGNNILCCSQEFSDINANSVNFKDIVQNCNQKIENNLSN
jgi:hypothetical protein